MYKNLYNCFKHWYTDNGTIYLYSDPHFSDLYAYKFRFPEEFKQFMSQQPELTTEENPLNLAVAYDCSEFIKKLDDMQIKNINKVCGKNDTLIILGDVGNIECVKKLKARYKVLILGNHDSGASNYLKSKLNIDYYNHCLYPGFEAEQDYARNLEYALKKLNTNYPDYHIVNKNVVQGYDCSEHYIFDIENNLFDEIYEGTLQISPKIILSHEPVDYKYLFNIHGHIHNINKNGVYVEKLDNELKNIGGWYNCCAEQINYTPVSLTSLIKLGMFSNVPDIHRETIDIANLRKNDQD